MNLLSIDPGPDNSAFVVYDGERVIEHGIEQNFSIILRIKKHNGPIACEMLACFGMPVGAETFETAYAIGAFMVAAFGSFNRVYRSDVKIHLCGSMRAKDSNIRQALIDKFGGSRESAIGTRKNPGPLYGVTSHCWSSLAIAVTFCEADKFLSQRASA